MNEQILTWLAAGRDRSIHIYYDYHRNCYKVCVANAPYFREMFIAHEMPHLEYYILIMIDELDSDMPDRTLP